MSGNWSWPLLLLLRLVFALLVLDDDCAVEELGRGMLEPVLVRDAPETDIRRLFMKGMKCLR